MRSNTGISTTEYVIIFSLLGIVLIPALSLLGGQINNNLQNAWQPQPVNNLVSLLDGPNNQPVAQAVLSSGPVQPTNNNFSPSIQASFNPATGQIMLQANPSGSSSVTTTSVEGTRLVANAILQDLNTLTSQPNVTLSASLEAKIQELSSFAFTLADEEEGYINSNLNSNQVLDVENRLADFSSLYAHIDDKLKQLTGQSSAYQQFSANLHAHASIVTHVAVHNVLNGSSSQSNGSLSGSITNKNTQYLVGNINTSGISQQQAPVVTQQSGTNIQQLSATTP